MAMYNKALVSGCYATMRSVFTKLFNDQILCKLLYYPQENDNDDPTLKADLSALERGEVIIITRDDDDLTGPNQTKRCKVTFSLGNTYKSYKNHKASMPIIFILIFVPRTGFQEMDFRLEAIIDRIDQLVSDNKFDGSFGRITKDSGNPYDAPKGYLGYTLRYQFVDTDF